MKRNEDSLRELWDNVKHTNIHIIGVPKGEERKDLRKYLRVIAEKFPNTGKEKVIQVHTESQEAEPLGREHIGAGEEQASEGWPTDSPAAGVTRLLACTGDPPPICPIKKVVIHQQQHLQPMQCSRWHRVPTMSVGSLLTQPELLHPL